MRDSAFRLFSPLLTAHTLRAYVLLFITTLALTILISWITYNLIEQPFIKLGESLARRINTVPEVQLRHEVVTAKIRDNLLAISLPVPGHRVRGKPI